MSSPVKLFIVEGENRDYRFIFEMTQCFFKGHYNATVICLPAAQNIYMLYSKLAADNFETDLVEVLRDTVEIASEKLTGISRQDIEEIYLFFDYDIHQNNTPVNGPDASIILQAMIEAFDNETENGKLYISYPMVEALYDYREGVCDAFSNCFVSTGDIGHYKINSGNNNPKASRTMTIQYWREVLNVYFLRIKCLFNLEDLDFLTYRKTISPKTIYTNERQLAISYNQVFILSAFPEFLFDYFKEDFWNTMTPIKRKHFIKCSKKEKTNTRNARP